MGIGIAWSRDTFQLMDCNIVRVADHIPCSKMVVDNPGFLTSVYQKGISITTNLLDQLFGVGSYLRKPIPVDQWEAARQKWNMMIMVSLIRLGL
jgi:hypothetical protein